MLFQVGRDKIKPSLPFQFTSAFPSPSEENQTFLSQPDIFPLKLKSIYFLVSKTFMYIHIICIIAKNVRLEFISLKGLVYVFS